MAEHTGQVDFWKGFAAGSLFGLIAAAYARGDFKRLLSVVPESALPAPEPVHTFREHARELEMRREASENAGDPSRLSPAIAAGSAPVAFERSSGSPGPSSTPETLEVPGRPGRPIDHSDAARPVHSALRTQNVSVNKNQIGA
jgi:hypothetical protein